MPFQPVPNTAHVALNGTLNSEQVQNNLFFVNPSGPFTDSDLEVLSQSVADWWGANLRPNQGPAYSLRQVTATSLQTAIDVQWTWSTGLPLAGTAGGATLPGNVAFCVSFRTGLSGRSARGRNFVPGLTEAQVTGNTVESATVNALVAAYALLLNPVTTGGYTWVIVQRRQDGVQLPAGITRNVGSVVAVDTNVDSQRRRLAGRGA